MVKREITLWPGEELVVQAAGIAGSRSLEQVLDEIVTAGHVEIQLARRVTESIWWSCHTRHDDRAAPDIKQDYAGWEAVAQPAHGYAPTALEAAENCLREIQKREAQSSADDDDAAGRGGRS